jgi:hypothetical protein
MLIWERAARRLSMVLSTKRWSLFLYAFYAGKNFMVKLELKGAQSQIASAHQARDSPK